MTEKQQRQCTICCRTYDDNAIPKLLPCCLQTICRNCQEDIKNTCGKASLFKCPYCREMYDYSAIEFDENTKLALSGHYFDTQKKCLYCIKVASNVCDVCGFLCQSCNHRHKRINDSSNCEHLVRDIVSELSWKFSQSCKIHPNNLLTAFCFDCDEFCCAQCILMHQKQHDYRTVDAVLHTKQGYLGKKIETIISCYKQTKVDPAHDNEERTKHSKEIKRIGSDSSFLSFESAGSKKSVGIIRFTQIAIRSKNTFNFLTISKDLECLLDKILSANCAASSYSIHDESDISYGCIFDENQKFPCKDDAVWRTYPIEGFPTAEYLERIMNNFCSRLETFKGTCGTSEEMHVIKYDRKVNIMFLGCTKTQNIRLVSKKRGKPYKDSEEDDNPNRKSTIPLPFIIVYFMEEGEAIENCIKHVLSLGEKFAGHIRSPLKRLIVNHKLEQKPDSISNGQCLIVSNQKEEVRKGLEILLEQSMFDTLERYEEGIDKECTSLLNEIRAIKSLKCQKNEKEANNVSTKNDVPQEAIQFLSGFEGIVAFGIWSSNFRILTKAALTFHQKREICDHLKEIDNSFFSLWNPSFYITNEAMYCPFSIHQGDKITKDNYRVENKRTSGTLGGFAIGSDEKLYGLTCQHVVPLKDLSVYLKEDLYNSIGKCIFVNHSNSKTLCDFAVFRVHDNIFEKCSRSISDEMNKFRKAYLYQEDVGNLYEKYIHKKGAVTEWTSGQIACAQLHVCIASGRQNREDLMVFEGFGEGKFAEQGDSGSLVIAHDPNKKTNLLVLGMVSGGDITLRKDITNESEQNQTVGDDTNIPRVSTYTMGFSLKIAIDLLKKTFPDLDLHFDCEVQSSSSESDDE